MIIADLHVHSRFSQACSKNTTVELLEKYAKIKGIDILSTSDFTHPLWRKELNEKLIEDENGILWTKNKFPFLWGTEISLIYTQEKGRRVHLLIYSPNKEVTDQITEALGKKGKLNYDGRPIFGFSCIELFDMMRSISEDIEIIPAHAWTSWYAIFGSKSGFNSIKECFHEKAKYIHAIETGMSSDPEMNWRLSQLNNINLVSFSDSHSFWPWRLGREATIFDVKELTYKNIIKAVRTGEGLSSTIETPVEYGKYHWSGHRNCNISFSPKETIKHKGVCPICKTSLTIGVADRIEELADRPENYKPKNAKPFVRLIPLTELIAFVNGTNLLDSKKIWTIYNIFIEKFGNEFKILLNVPYEELIKIDKNIAELIIKSREGKLNIKPGFDGTYGQIINGEKKEEITTYPPKQKNLNDF